MAKAVKKPAKPRSAGWTGVYEALRHDILALVLPLSVGVVVKAFAWTILLRSNGLVNKRFIVSTSALAGLDGVWVFTEQIRVNHPSRLPCRIGLVWAYEHFGQAQARGHHLLSGPHRPQKTRRRRQSHPFFTQLGTFSVASNQPR